MEQKGVTSMRNIMVLGSLNMDVILKVNELPQKGETIIATGLEKTPGGKGANQAVAAAKFGAAVRMVGCVGADQDGREILDGMSAAGVDISGVTYNSAEPTGIALITIERGGANTIAVYQGANSGCDLAGDAAIDGLYQSDAILAQLEIPRRTVEKAFVMARGRGIRTILNPSPVCPLSAELLAHTDCLVPNEVEASALCGGPIAGPESALKAAAKLRGMGPERVVITLGAQGAVYAGPEGERFVPAFPVDAVDTTGAGDTFIAVFATIWLEGHGIETCLDYAAAAGAITASRMGAQIALPTRREVEEMLSEAKPGFIPVR